MTILVMLKHQHLTEVADYLVPLSSPSFPEYPFRRSSKNYALPDNGTFSPAFVELISSARATRPDVPVLRLVIGLLSIALRRSAAAHLGPLRQGSAEIPRLAVCAVSEDASERRAHGRWRAL